MRGIVIRPAYSASMLTRWLPPTRDHAEAPVGERRELLITIL
jgi:hypothetical protein